MHGAHGLGFFAGPMQTDIGVPRSYDAGHSAAGKEPSQTAEALGIRNQLGFPAYLVAYAQGFCSLAGTGSMPSWLQRQVPVFARATLESAVYLFRTLFSFSLPFLPRSSCFRAQDPNHLP